MSFDITPGTLVAGLHDLDHNSFERMGDGGIKYGDVTLLRGMVNTPSLAGWLSEVREGASSQLGPRQAASLQSWSLDDGVPQHYEGPPLSSKEGGDVSMEELVLSTEGVEILLKR